MSKEVDYKKAFGLGYPANKEKAEKALEQALDIRKFEIGLYWQRAAYFWALIAAAFAGYFVILGAEHLCDKEYLAFIVSCVGGFFTWAWLLANRGSKYWQENWENHVVMLEDSVTGPLYKTGLHRPKEGIRRKSPSRPGKPPELKWRYFWEFLITEPKAFSVSKIHLWVNAFTLLIWLVLASHAFLAEFQWAVLVKYAWVKTPAVFGMTLVGEVWMWRWGQTYPGPHYPLITTRRTFEIIDPPPPPPIH